MSSTSYPARKECPALIGRAAYRVHVRPRDDHPRPFAVTSKPAWDVNRPSPPAWGTHRPLAWGANRPPRATQPPAYWAAYWAAYHAPARALTPKAASAEDQAWNAWAYEWAQGPIRPRPAAAEPAQSPVLKLAPSPALKPASGFISLPASGLISPPASDLSLPPPTPPRPSAPLAASDSACLSAPAPACALPTPPASPPPTPRPPPLTRAAAWPSADTDTEADALLARACSAHHIAPPAAAPSEDEAALRGWRAWTFDRGVCACVCCEAGFAGWRRHGFRAGAVPPVL